MNPDGSTEIRVRESATAPWKTLVTAPFGENVSVLDITADGAALLLISSLNANTNRVIRKEIATGTETVIAENPNVDAGEVMIHPVKHVVQAVDFPAGRQAWTVIDPLVKGGLRGHLEAARRRLPHRQSRPRRQDLAGGLHRGPRAGRYYAWDRETRRDLPLRPPSPGWKGCRWPRCARVVPGPRRPHAERLPDPPGGREGRRTCRSSSSSTAAPGPATAGGYNPYAQWLANRGYAVMQVNFRGSTGYGKKFLNAGNKQWGKAMHTDLLDAVDWTVKQGWVDANKVAIMGGSYGGYSALAGVTFTPDVFKCSVDIVGPSNLFTLLQSIPPYWAPMIAQFHQRMGDPKTDEALLKAASPLFSADKIKVPLLIGQGANDPRVKQAESEQIVAAIEKNGGGVTYVLYPDEGHGFARPENRIDFNARAEAFLATCLGGRVEPLPAGDKVPGSTAVVKVVQPKAK